MGKEIRCLVELDTVGILMIAQKANELGLQNTILQLVGSGKKAKAGDVEELFSLDIKKGDILYISNDGPLHCEIEELIETIQLQITASMMPIS